MKHTDTCTRTRMRTGMVGAGWGWLGLVGAGWGWLGLVGAGWGWLGLVGAGWGWLGLVGAGWGWLRVLVTPIINNLLTQTKYEWKIF